jgi:hypothetical protein
MYFGLLDCTQKNGKDDVSLAATPAPKLGQKRLKEATVRAVRE